MTPSELNLRALNARDLIHRSIEAATAIWPRAAVRLQVQSNIGNFDFQGTMGDDVAAHASIAPLVAIAEENDFVHCSNLEVSVETSSRQEGFRYASPNGLLASIQVKPLRDTSRARAVVEALKSHFELLPIDGLTNQMMPVPQVAALQLREASVADLHAGLSKLGNLLATITVRDVELRASRMAELDAEHQARIKTFEHERTAALEHDEQERKVKQEELAAKEADLQRRIAEHDARESKLARRDLQKDLNKLLDEFGKFSLSEDTAKKRSPVRTGVGILALAFLSLAVIAGYNYFTTLDLHYLPASTAGVLGFAGTMLFFVKWSDQWFREHADEEMQSKRYKADMLRASWIAELAAEWAKEGKDAPPELLTVFAKNLFMTSAAVPEVEHPADAILGLLKRAQKLDVSKDRVTVEAGATSPPK